MISEMMNHSFLLPLVALLCVSCSGRFTIANNSNSELISPDHYRRCIEQGDYKSLIPKVRYKNDKVLFEYSPAASDTTSCDGIYYYRLVSRSFRQPLFRDSEGNRYTEFGLFLIIHGRIHALWNRSQEDRKKLIETERPILEAKFGVDAVRELEPYIVAGNRRFY